MGMFDIFKSSAKVAEDASGDVQNVIAPLEKAYGSFKTIVPKPMRSSFPRWTKESLPGVMPGRAIRANEFDAIGAEILQRGQYDSESDDSGVVDPAVDLRVDGRIVRLNSLENVTTSQIVTEE